MMNYIENGMPRVLGCPYGLASFYDKLHLADDERLHAIGVSARCSREGCSRLECPFRLERADSETLSSRNVDAQLRCT
jgi:hypothetical protein